MKAAGKFNLHRVRLNAGPRSILVGEKTYLTFSNGPNFPRAGNLACHSPNSRFNGPTNGTLCRDPIPNFIGDNFNKSDSGIVNIAMVDTILQIPKPSGRTVLKFRQKSLGNSFYGR